MSMPPSRRTNDDNGHDDEPSSSSKSPLYYHVPGVSSPTGSEEESNNHNGSNDTTTTNNSSNNNNAEEYQQDFETLLFLELEEIMQQHRQRPPNETVQQMQQNVPMTTTTTTMTSRSPVASPRSSSSTTSSSSSARAGLGAGRGASRSSTPRPFIDHESIPVPTTLSSLLSRRGVSGSSSSSGDKSPNLGNRVVVATPATTNSNGPTPVAPPLPIASSSSSTTANNSPVSIGNKDTTTSPFVLAGGHDDNQDVDSRKLVADHAFSPVATGGGGGGATAFRLIQGQRKHPPQNSSSEIVAHDVDDDDRDSRVIQRANVVDEKRGSSDDDDDYSGARNIEGVVVPTFDKHIHSDTRPLAKPMVYSRPAGAATTTRTLNGEAKRQDYDSTISEEEEEELFVYNNAGGFTNRFPSERFHTVRLSTSPVAHHDLASPTSGSTASSGTATNATNVTLETMRSNELTAVATEESSNTGTATNANRRIIPFDTSSTTTRALPKLLMDAEAAWAFNNLTFAVALMAAVSTILLSTPGIPSGRIASVVLAIINVFIALSTMHKASRYMNRFGGLAEVMDAKVCFCNPEELIFLSGFSVFATSLLFAVSRIIGLQLLEDVSFWVNTLTNIGVLVAITHFGQKLFDLLNLWSALSKKAERAGHNPQDLRTVRYLTFAHIMLTLLLSVAAVAALVAMVWSAIVKGLGGITTSMPFWFSLGTAAVMTASFALQHYLLVFYNTPHPGLVCNLFRQEIAKIFQVLSVCVVGTNNTLVIAPHDERRQDRRQCWEHTASMFVKQYRFDHLFSPRRLTALLQYLQSDPMEPCNEI